MKIIVILFLFLFSQEKSISQSVYPFTSYPIEKIRPNTKPPRINHATLNIAGNEYEPVLFGIFNGSKKNLTVKQVVVTVFKYSNLFKYNVYSVKYIYIKKPSRWFDIFNIKGRWPDPMIPCQVGKSDITVPPGENRTWIIDIYRVPDSTFSNGMGKIKVNLIFDNDSVINHSVSIDIGTKLAPFNLPKKSSFATAFGFSSSSVIKKHREMSSVKFNAEMLKKDYLHILALNRISVYYPMDKRIPIKAKDDKSIIPDWSNFDAVTGSLLEGNMFNDAPPQTSFRTPLPPKGLNKNQLMLFYCELGKHLKNKGWIDRAFFYLPDEPIRKQYPEVIRIASFIKKSFPGLRTLVTEPFTKELEGYIDIWCPDITHIGDTVPFLPAYFKGKKLVLDWQWNPFPSIYQKRRKLGETTWFYTCMSAQFLDYPNLFIDSSAMHNRIIPWLAYRYGFTGLLYWETVYDYKKGRDPWKDQYQFFCNGDGNLLYPGTPEITKSDKHIPLPSLRLLLLREGMEDYEYLKLLEKNYGKKLALSYVKKVVRGSLDWNHKPVELIKLKDKIINKLSQN